MLLDLLILSSPYLHRFGSQSQSRHNLLALTLDFRYGSWEVPPSFLGMVQVRLLQCLTFNALTGIDSPCRISSATSVLPLSKNSYEMTYCSEKN